MKKLIKIFKTIIYSICIQFIIPFVRRNENYLAFGSWCGELYIDNSKYLFEYALNNLKDYKFVWVGDESLTKYMPKDERIKLVKKDSFTSIIALIKCKYMFCTQMHRADLSSYNVFRGAVIYSLDHGVPVKKWAQDAVGYKGEFENKNIVMKIYQMVIGESRKYDYFITASPLHDAANLTALAYRGATMSKNLPSGTPRNDLLVNYNSEYAVKLKKKYADLIGFDDSKKIIMYLPTYRRTTDKMETFLDRSSDERERLNKVLKKYNAIIIEKNHFATNKQGINNLLNSEDFVIKLTHKVDLQEMLLFTDIQISDYSGCYLDFILLDRPVIHYAYDYEYYKDKDSGLYYDIKDFSAGKITKTFDETLIEIENLLSGNDMFIEKRKYVRQKYMTYEKGTACKQIIESLGKNSND